MAEPRLIPLWMVKDGGTPSVRNLYLKKGVYTEYPELAAVYRTDQMASDVAKTMPGHIVTRAIQVFLEFTTMALVSAGMSLLNMAGVSHAKIIYKDGRSIAYIYLPEDNDHETEYTLLWNIAEMKFHVVGIDNIREDQEH